MIDVTNFYKVIIVINLITKGMILILGFIYLINDHFCICMIIVITDLKQQVIISVIILILILEFEKFVRAACAAVVRDAS